MGSGKGTPEYWVAVVKPPAVLCLRSLVSLRRSLARFLRLASPLPIKTKIVARTEEAGE
ncbi:ribosomal protein L16 [Dysosmobacter welbionis]|uniref:ribosomal protein L16 n=1 Tax=Dysosmobacter welbionis TaxID=2093857 RepID=UPI004039B58C